MSLCNINGFGISSSDTTNSLRAGFLFKNILHKKYLEVWPTTVVEEHWATAFLNISRIGIPDNIRS
jgi:hypothetical protein